jgi:pantetheine-phosphate adenylyltransferase
MKHFKSAVYQGSFDPLHTGHIDIITRASKLFDMLYVVVSFNVGKSQQTPVLKRFQQVKKTISKLKLANVKVMVNKSLTVHLLKQLKCNYIVRSVRDTQDFKYELELAQINHYLDQNIETLLFVADSKLKNISSRTIRETQHQID